MSRISRRTSTEGIRVSGETENDDMAFGKL